MGVGDWKYCAGYGSSVHPKQNCSVAFGGASGCNSSVDHSGLEWGLVS